MTRHGSSISRSCETFAAQSVYFLVAHSLYDRSPKVRETARKAVVLQASLARPYYIEALKSRDPGLASLAAKAIVEIGDPNGETVPYLIDTLSFQTLREVVTSKVTQPLDGARVAEIALQQQDYALAQAALNAPPVKITIRPGPRSIIPQRSNGNGWNDAGKPAKDYYRADTPHRPADV